MAGLNLFTNNAATTLASNITNVATTLTVATGTGALFPSPTAGEYFYCTLANNAGTVEIIKVTARSGDTFSTITRGQDGTSAVSWSAGDKVELRLVNADLTNFPQLDSTNTFSQQQTMSNLTASKPVFTDSSKGLVSTGTVPTDQGGTGLTTFTAANNAIYSTSGSALTAGTLPIAAGGTGATTKTAAFDALAPTTTNGDMMYFNGTDVVRLPIGTTDQVLKVSGGIPAWAADSGGFTNLKTIVTNGGSVSIPAGVTTCKITVIGGGAAGGNAGGSSSGTVASGGGGGSGGASISYFTGFTNTAGVTVSCSAMSTAGTTTATFLGITLSCTAGSTPATAINNSYSQIGGAAGSASASGTITSGTRTTLLLNGTPGNTGGQATSNANGGGAGGAGGASLLAGAGVGGRAGAGGAAFANSGSGGGGAGGAGSTQNGGAGSAGIIIVEY